MRAGKDPIGLAEGLDDMGAFGVGQRARGISMAAVWRGLFQLINGDRKSVV